jgi:putative ABC transport system permease protein
VSISANASFGSVIKYRSTKTNPDVRVLGGDMQYLEASGFELEEGRNFSSQEIELGSATALLGYDVIKKLNMRPEEIIDKEISIDSRKYKVIGVLASKGASMGMSNDKQVIVPLKNVKLNLARADTQYLISVATEHPEDLDRAADAAIGTFRVIRGDRIGAEESFEIRSSDSTAENVIESLGFISLAATFIGIITLLGAAIGLMNIMLVSVTERTREIGVRKSIGASSSAIRWQFLTEAIAIGQIGGLIGTIFGIAAGNGIAMLVGGQFIIPWAWIAMAVAICLVVSVVSGFYPANKAANLDPIDALRYE